MIFILQLWVTILHILYSSWYHSSPLINPHGLPLCLVILLVFIFTWRIMNLVPPLRLYFTLCKVCLLFFTFSCFSYFLLQLQPSWFIVFIIFILWLPLFSSSITLKTSVFIGSITLLLSWNCFHSISVYVTSFHITCVLLKSLTHNLVFIHSTHASSYHRVKRLRVVSPKQL